MKSLDLISRFNSGFRFNKMLLTLKPKTSTVAFKYTESIDRMMTFAAGN